MPSKKSKAVTVRKTPSYDPQKNYQWKPEDVFPLSGTDLSILFHTMREMALSNTGTAPANIVASYEILNKIIVESVESGLIKEAPADLKAVK